MYKINTYLVVLAVIILIIFPCSSQNIPTALIARATIIYEPSTPIAIHSAAIVNLETPVGTSNINSIVASDQDSQHNEGFTNYTFFYSDLTGSMTDSFRFLSCTAYIYDGNKRVVTFEKVSDTPLWQTYNLQYTIDDVVDWPGSGDNPVDGSLVDSAKHLCWYGPGDIGGPQQICRNSTAKFCAQAYPSQYSETSVDRLHWYYSTSATANDTNTTEITGSLITVDKSTTTASKSMMCLPGLTPGHYWIWVRAEERNTLHQITKATPWIKAKYYEIDVVEMPKDRPDCGSSSSCDKGCQQCYSVDPKDGYISEWPVIAATAGPHIPMLPLSASTAGDIYTKGKPEIIAVLDGGCSSHTHLHAYGADGKVQCANIEAGSSSVLLPSGGTITQNANDYSWKHLDGTVETYAHGPGSSDNSIYDFISGVVNPDGSTTSSSYTYNGNVYLYTYINKPYGGKATWLHLYTVVEGNLTQYNKYRGDTVDNSKIAKHCAYTYTNGRLQGITIAQPNEVDKSVSVSYDSQGNLNSINQNGKVTKFTRGTNSVPTMTVTSEDASGNQYAAVDYAFGGLYTTISARDVTNSGNYQTSTLNYVVDTNGNKRYVFSIDEPSGLTTPSIRTTSSILYVPSGFTCGLSSQIAVVTDQPLWGKVVSETVGNRITSYEYNSSLGKVTKIIYPEVTRGVISSGNVADEVFTPAETFQYDTAGRLTQKQLSHKNTNGTLTPYQTEIYAYDANGQTTYSSYSRDNHVVASTMVYNTTTGALQTRSTTTTENAIIKSMWQYSYLYYTSSDDVDLAGLTKSVELVDTLPDNDLTMSLVEYSYKSGSVLQPGATSVTSTYYIYPGGIKTTWKIGTKDTFTNQYQYDTFGNMVKSFDANGKWVEYSTTVDSGTNLKTERVLYSQQAYTETVSDCCKLLYQTDVDGKTVYYSYDPIGRIVKTYTNEAGQSEDTPLMQYAYDGFGRVSSVTSRSNASTPRVTTYTYDKRNRVTTIANPGNLANEQYYYDIYGNLMAKSYGGGRTTMYKHDALNRVIDIYNRSTIPIPLDYPTTTPFVHKMYKNETSTLMADVMASVGQYRYATNGLGQLTSTYWPLRSKTISYTYDTMGRKSSVSDGSNTTTYAYDPMGNLATISLGTNPATTIATYTTDYVGNRTHVLYGNGTSQDFSYGDDARYMLAGIDYAYQCNSATTTGGIRITRTNGGNPLSWADSTDKFIKTFSYDNQGRLTSADIPGVSRTNYGYDWVGNRTSPTAVYNAADQLTSYSGNTYSYNTYGDMTSGAGRTYTYNASSGVLNNITQNGGTYSNTFGPNGMRVSYDDQGEYIVYAYDVTASIPAIISEEYPWDSSPSTYYVREPNGALVMRLNGTDKKYYHFDELGNTLFLTDANGVQTDKYVYNAWGKVVSSSGTTVNPFKYVGRLGYYSDAGTGLLSLGARFYDPEAGVFTQRDAAKDGLSYYAYTSGHSMVAVDPWGLSPYTDTVQFWLPWLYRLADNYGSVSGMYDGSRASGWDVIGQASLFSFGLGVTAFAWEKTAADFIPRASAQASYIAGHVYEEPVIRRTFEYTAGRVARGICGIANTVTPIYSDWTAISKAIDCYKNGHYHWEITEDGWLTKEADKECVKLIGPAQQGFVNSFIQGLIGIGTLAVRR